MGYALLNPTFAAQFEGFTRARGFAFALKWNPRLYRWILVQRKTKPTLTHELLQGVPDIGMPYCKWEPLFICSDSENGCLKEPGPWIFAEIAKRAKRGDDQGAKDAMLRRIRERDARQDRLMAHQGQHPGCSECERSLHELPAGVKAELAEFERDWQKYGTRGATSIVVAKR